MSPGNSGQEGGGAASPELPPTHQFPKWHVSRPAFITHRVVNEFVNGSQVLQSETGIKLAAVVGVPNLVMMAMKTDLWRNG